MIIKTTFKSHFKIKKNFKKNKSKFIFVKNIAIFFLFFKIFLKDCSVQLLFSNKKKNQINLLKAPSRHKKFFHQICFEVFVLKVFFYFLIKFKIPLNNCISFFERLGFILNRFGTNTLTKTKHTVRFLIKHFSYFHL